MQLGRASQTPSYLGEIYNAYEHNGESEKFCGEEASLIVYLNISQLIWPPRFFFFSLKSVNVPLDLLWDALIWIW